MTQQALREVEHEIIVRATAVDVYRLLAEVENWPLIFPPPVYVDYVERGETEERIRIWATANGEVKNWTSKRTLDPEALRIEFRREASTPPIATMGGAWIIEPICTGESRVRLLHDYRATEDDPEKLAWIDRAVDRNSRSELAALKANAELSTGAAELMLSFEDSVRIEGSAKDVYDFINEAQHWPERLPHVVDVSLREETPGLQILRMNTLTSDGSLHTTESVRVCLPPCKIAYKQTTLSDLMSLHTGCWQLEEDEAGITTTATSQHTVAINADNITKILGEDADIPAARHVVRNTLGSNSRATLGYAKQYAEARR